MTETDDTPHKKPRLAIMGEFSAGKSTLTNLFLGARPLPERVTATRLSPVWISHGTGTPYRERLDGQREPVSVHKIDEVPIEDTRSIRMFFEADVLELCDIIDFPGISDPNMDAEVWQRVVAEADIILWCTHATQAWRQSEAAVWDLVPDHIRQRSLLLVTRFDKLTTDRDKNRVLARLRHETDGLFDQVFPVALLQALEGRDDVERWQSSGAGPMLDRLVEILSETSQGETPSRAKPGMVNMTAVIEPEPDHKPVSDQPGVSDIRPPAPVSEVRIMPRRVARPLTARDVTQKRRSRPVAVPDHP